MCGIYSQQVQKQFKILINFYVSEETLLFTKVGVMLPIKELVGVAVTLALVDDLSGT